MTAARSSLVCLAASLGVLAGCPLNSRVALERGVLAYDHAVVTTSSRLLLLNVARIHQSAPVHFSSISSINATYNFQFSAGVGPAATGEWGWLPMPSIGTSVGETPTLTILPMQGEEFSSRLLRPFDEAKVVMLLEQGYDVDALLRLIGESWRVRGERGDRVFHNRPTDREGYQVFRRVTAQLSSAQDRNLLRVRPLSIATRQSLPLSALSSEQLQALSALRSFRYAADRQVVEFDAAPPSRYVITNYDMDARTDDERESLSRELDRSGDNELLFDLRADLPGGEVPLRGWMNFRSFYNVLDFVGRGVGREPERDVAPDPRTPAIRENPARALAIIELDRAPSDAELSVRFGDKFYAIAPDSGYPWNRRAFAILFQLFQLTLATSRAPPPLISVGR